MNICLCIPNNYPHFPVKFALSMFKIQTAFAAWQRDAERYDNLSVLIVGGFDLATMRNNLVKDALTAEQDLLIFMDADMIFPDNLVERMVEVLEANPEFEAVTGLYTWKKPPYLPHIFSKFNKKTKQFGIIGAFPLDNVFEVHGAGAGCMAVKAEVFKREKPPYFKFATKGEIKEISNGLGEDLYFCWKFKPKMLCDPSLACGHLDTRPVYLKDYIRYNKIKVADGKIKLTRKRMDEIADKHHEMLEH